MTCPKCGSSSVASAADEAPTPGLQWMKCHPCGKRWDASGVLLQIRAEAGLQIEGDSEEEPGATTLRSVDEIMQLAMRDVTVTREQPQEEDKEMPRFNSPEAKQRWLDAMAKRRGKKRGEKTAVGGGRTVAHVPAMQDAATAARRSQPSAAAIHVNILPSSTSDAIREIDAALVMLRDEAAVLERAKEILARR